MHIFLQWSVTYSKNRCECLSEQTGLFTMPVYSTAKVNPATPIYKYTEGCDFNSLNIERGLFVG